MNHELRTAHNLFGLMLPYYFETVIIFVPELKFIIFQNVLRDLNFINEVIDSYMKRKEAQWDPMAIRADEVIRINI